MRRRSGKVRQPKTDVLATEPRRQPCVCVCVCVCVCACVWCSTCLCCEAWRRRWTWTKFPLISRSGTSRRATVPNSWRIAPPPADCSSTPSTRCESASTGRRKCSSTTSEISPDSRQFTYNTFPTLLLLLLLLSFIATQGQHKTFTYTQTNTRRIRIQKSYGMQSKNHKILSESRVIRSSLKILEYRTCYHITPSYEHRPHFERRALDIFLSRCLAHYFQTD